MDTVELGSPVDEVYIRLEANGDSLYLAAGCDVTYWRSLTFDERAKFIQGIFMDGLNITPCTRSFSYTKIED